MSLTPFERIILEALLAGELDDLAVLRAQASAATVTKREMTGVGFFTTFSVPDHCSRLSRSKGQTWLADVGADLVGVEHGVGFVLFLRDGQIAVLEGFTYGESPWPAVPELLHWRYLSRERGSATLRETSVRALDQVQSGLQGRHP